MWKIRYILPAIALILSACGGESDASGPADDEFGSGNPESPAVASIVVEGPVVMLWDAGVSTRLTASALGSSGQVIPGITFEWTSADPLVATVEDGVVTAVGDGWTEAMASALGESGGVSIVVVTPDGPKDRTDCIACHADSYAGQHAGTNTPETCLQCHSGPSWARGDFDHPSVANGFELLGAHSLMSCAACHEADGTPKYPGVADDECIACHQSDYDGRHGGSNTPETCLQCHTRDEWTGADFDHSAASGGFDLLGAHTSLACTACHEADGTPKYPGVGDNQCVACHQSDYNGEHGGSGYPTTCLQCHTRDEWTGADFDHSAASSGFDLVGAHTSLACTACHEADGTPKYPGVGDNQCVACHQSDYDGEHGGSGYPTTCLTCHTRDSFSGGDFDHSAASSGFDLLGAHTSLACTACHEANGTPKYPGVGDNQCVACHQSDYNGEHGGSGYPTTCLQCHTRDEWTGADFDHSAASSGFDLLGAHTSLACTACHEADGTPKYPGVGDNQCVACHQSDYNGEHGGSGYPTTCLTCHTRDSFSGADFDHDAQYFPISAGKHQGKWSGCATCHVDPSDYTDFSCFACHVHDQNRMDDKHSERAGYAYDSDLCYACHPRGQAE